MTTAPRPAVAAALYCEIEGCRYAVRVDVLGEVYLVTKAGSDAGYPVAAWPDGTALCGCPGFSYRGRCRHLAALRAVALLPPAVEGSGRE